MVTPLVTKYKKPGRKLFANKNEKPANCNNAKGWRADTRLTADHKIGTYIEQGKKNPHPSRELATTKLSELEQQWAIEYQRKHEVPRTQSTLQKITYLEYERKEN